jgi:phosphatidylglycerol:prolipoprotein diacylglycerol transferase
MEVDIVMRYLDQIFGLSPARYQVILALGYLMGTALAVVRGRRRGLSPTTMLDAALAAALGGLLLGRGVYAGLNWTYFQDHLGEAARIWRGGLSAPGVIVGAGASVLILCRWQQIDPRPVLDAMAPGAASVSLAAWLACLAAGCAWGIEVWPDQGLLWHLRAELPDLYGVRAPRLPVQGMGIIWSAGLLLATWLAERRGRPFPLWLALHAAGDLGFRFLRGDIAPVAGGLGPGQLGDLALLLLGLALWLTPIWRRDGDRVQ